MKTPSTSSHASPGTLTFSLLVLGTCKVDKNKLSCKGAITCHFSVGLGHKEFRNFLTHLKKNFLANPLDSRQLGIALYFHVPGYSLLQLDFIGVGLWMV